MATLSFLSFNAPTDIRTHARLLVAALAAMLLLLLSSPLQAQQVQPASPTSAPAYVFGPNDGLTVTVYGQGEFNVSTRVKPDGSIVMPLIGKIQAEGKTVLTLADEITRRLVQGNFLRDPIVNIEVTEHASNYVRVIGRVGSQGLVPLSRSTRLLDVLLLSGWVQESGNKEITLRRANGQMQQVNMEDIALGKAPDIVLANGDTIFVPEAEVVYLVGAAARPGTYPLKRDMNINELMAMAGGVGATGSSGRFGLKRGDAKEIDVQGTDKLQAGDVIRVRERLF